MVKLQQERQEKQERIQIFEITDEQVKEFEKELENYKLLATTDKPLNYYGIPLKNQEKHPGYVVNEIISGVHWSVIKYCLSKEIIGRRYNGTWFIVAEVLNNRISGEGYIEIRAYGEFIRKWKALEKFKYREISNKKYQEFQEDLDSKEDKALEFIEKMAFEQDDIRPESLPF